MQKKKKLLQYTMPKISVSYANYFITTALLVWKLTQSSHTDHKSSKISQNSELLLSIKHFRLTNNCTIELKQKINTLEDYLIKTNIMLVCRPYFVSVLSALLQLSMQQLITT